VLNEIVNMEGIGLKEKIDEYLMSLYDSCNCNECRERKGVLKNATN